MKENNRYNLNLPVLSSQILDQILAKGDATAKVIYHDVVLPHLIARQEKSEQLGLRYALPGDVLVREFALQELIAEDTLPAPAAPPVPWNSGVWGWEGHLRFGEETE